MKKIFSDLRAGDYVLLINSEIWPHWKPRLRKIVRMYSNSTILETSDIFYWQTGYGKAWLTNSVVWADPREGIERLWSILLYGRPELDDLEKLAAATVIRKIEEEYESMERP